MKWIKFDYEKWKNYEFKFDKKENQSRHFILNCDDKQDYFKVAMVKFRESHPGDHKKYLEAYNQLTKEEQEGKEWRELWEKVRRKPVFTTVTGGKINHQIIKHYINIDDLTAPQNINMPSILDNFSYKEDSKILMQEIKFLLELAELIEKNDDPSEAQRCALITNLRAHSDVLIEEIIEIEKIEVSY